MITEVWVLRTFLAKLDEGMSVLGAAAATVEVVQDALAKLQCMTASEKSALLEQAVSWLLTQMDVVTDGSEVSA